MPTPAHDDTAHEQAELERLATELGRRGLHGELCTPPGKLPYLQVRNPQVSALTEWVYAQAGAYWYSWAQRIADTTEPAETAAALARVLAATDLAPSE
ncbi:MAG TPA: hypothetical protein VGH27_30865 [Streptosporangiaceae bacterium]|jgi:hypothetical protein